MYKSLDCKNSFHSSCKGKYKNRNPSACLLEFVLHSPGFIHQTLGKTPVRTESGAKIGKHEHKSEENVQATCSSKKVACGPLR